MTSIRIIPRYEDHLWYPILVKMGGGHRIVELQGREVNAWNGYSAETKMNERIEQLALECYQAPEFDYKKFAELIVEECRNVLTEVYRETPIECCGHFLRADEKIAEHFYAG